MNPQRPKSDAEIERQRAEHEQRLHEHEQALEQRRYAPPGTPGLAPTGIGTPVYTADGGRLVGWVWGQGCEHPVCVAAVAEGRPYHAAPLAEVVLPDYHFETFEQAVAALEGVAND